MASPNTSPRFPLLDSLRALAALSILALHAAFISVTLANPLLGPPLAHLNVGVTVFFLLSGFLLYRPFVAGRSRAPGPRRFRRYLRRRVLRIFPAYWLALTVLTIYPGLYGTWGDHWWAYYGLVHLFFPADPRLCTAHLSGCGLAQTWSLCIEVTFYVGLPLSVVAMESLLRRCTFVGAFTLELLVLLGAAAAGVVAAIMMPIGTLLYPLVTSVPWFASGMALAVLSVAMWGRERQSATLRLLMDHSNWMLGFALVTYLVLSYWVLPHSASVLDYTPAQRGLATLLFAIIAAALLFPAIFGQDGSGIARRILRARPLTWLGTISYGIFLWHLTILLKVSTLGARDWGAGHHFLPVVTATLIPTVALAAVSYYALERPLLNRSRRGPVMASQVEPDVAPRSAGLGTPG